MRINPFAMPALVLVALFGTVFTAQAMGQWSTSGRIAIDPAKMTAADLKGWMTLQDVMVGLQISQEQLYAAGKIPTDVPPSTALNKLEALVPGFSVTTLRDALSGKSVAPSAGSTTIPPAPGATSTPTPVASTTPTTKGPGADGGTGTTPLPPGQVLPADQIKGKMTLREVSAQCAVPLDALLQKLNLTGISPDTLIKDLIAKKSLSEVTDVQKAVAELQGR
jgi:hypothetical protein